MPGAAVCCALHEPNAWCVYLAGLSAAPHHDAQWNCSCWKTTLTAAVLTSSSDPLGIQVGSCASWTLLRSSCTPCGIVNLEDWMYVLGQSRLETQYHGSELLGW